LRSGASWCPAVKKYYASGTLPLQRSSDHFSYYCLDPDTDSLNEIPLPTLTELRENFVQVGGYAVSYLMVRYLVDRYGMEVVPPLIENPIGVKSIIGIPWYQFYDEWKEYMIKRYTEYN
jgi:hypothetical protein